MEQQFNLVTAFLAGAGATTLMVCGTPHTFSYKNEKAVATTEEAFLPVKIQVRENTPKTTQAEIPNPRVMATTRRLLEQHRSLWEALANANEG